MSIAEFNHTIQSVVFKEWLSSLDKNIINATVSDIRKKEQTADKTDFILSVKDVKNMYKSVTSKEMTNSKASRILRDIAKAGELKVPAKVLRVGGSGAILFESIGFDTISKYVTSVFDGLEGVQEAYAAAREAYVDKKYKEISENTKFKNGAEKQKAIDAVDKAAKNIGFGHFLHKGHVISLATNSVKNFKTSLEEASQFTKEQKDLLISVLDKYIAKLEADDLATANLPNAHKQEIYAKYIKSSSKYLVEIQISSTNLEAGSASLPIANELRDVFSSSGAELEAILNKSPALGKTLLQSKGSPSMLELITRGLVAALRGEPKDNKEYRIPKTKIADRSRKIHNKNNKVEISKLKSLKNKTNRINTRYAVSNPNTDEFYSLTSLQSLINASLAQKIKENMGDGTRRDILNLRTGRFAESVNVERLSQSKAGMITAFYSYMRNPYATFSDGGKQQYPKSRDPKLLISKSIREIAASQVGNRMRAVLV